MTDLNLTHLRSVAGAATPGPWHESPHDGAVDNADWDCITDDVYYARDRRHIAAFDPPTVLALVARIEELEAENARLVSDMKTVNEVTRNTVEHLKATIQRVRDVHKPVTHHLLAKYCQCGQTIPCRTIQTLEGDPA